MDDIFNNEIKEQLLNCYNGYCSIQGCLNKANSVHHMLKNSAYNRKKYPLFVHSIFNAKLLCEYHHTQKQFLFKINDREAQMYEDYLNKLKGEIL